MSRCVKSGHGESIPNTHTYVPPTQPEVVDNPSPPCQGKSKQTKIVLTLARGSALTMHVKTSRSPGPEKTARWADDTSGGSELSKYIHKYKQVSTKYLP